MTIRGSQRIEEFTGDHAREILKTNKESQNFTEQQIEYAVSFYQMKGNKSYTLIVDEVPVLCGGIVNQGFGNGEVWIFMSGLFFTKYKILCHRTLKKAFRVLAKEMKLKRVQALIDMEIHSPINEKWIKSFGFEPEGIMKKYGINNEDYYRYARLF